LRKWRVRRMWPPMAGSDLRQASAAAASTKEDAGGGEVAAVSSGAPSTGSPADGTAGRRGSMPAEDWMPGRTHPGPPMGEVRQTRRLRGPQPNAGAVPTAAASRLKSCSVASLAPPAQHQLPQLSPPRENKQPAKKLLKNELRNG
jgi:hypothetical protein